MHGTFDSRGIRQWREAKRKIRKGSKAIYILAPREYEYYKCECGKVAQEKAIKENKCSSCGNEIRNDEIKNGVYFLGVPVFRAEDTEGAPLRWTRRAG